jgi:RNA-directed DNA polymerase
MRRAGNLFDGVVTFENLMAATKKAARGKRGAAATARFLERAEFEALALRRELIEGTWQPGKPTTFTIRDPKVRVITAVPFRDRVVHHAVMSALAPIFDRRMIAGSFACRRGKGSHAAVSFAHGLLRRYGFFLKLDIQKCFGSLDHDVVLGVVGRVVKDRRVLALLHRIVSAGGDAGRGLPIGSLTSQWLANLTLDRLDHHVKEVLRIPGYARYMDDFVLFSNDRESLRAAHAALGEFLASELRLAIKEKATPRAGAARVALPRILAPSRHDPSAAGKSTAATPAIAPARCTASR